MCTAQIAPVHSVKTLASNGSIKPSSAPPTFNRQPTATSSSCSSGSQSSGNAECSVWGGRYCLRFLGIWVPLYMLEFIIWSIVIRNVCKGMTVSRTPFKPWFSSRNILSTEGCCCLLEDCGRFTFWFRTIRFLRGPHSIFAVLCSCRTAESCGLNT